MFTSLICGSSFHEQELEDDGPLSCGNSPRSVKKSRTKRNSLVPRCSSDKGHSKNPYSRVGLDKFSALLSDLEERKKNIYLQKDSHEIMFVRFVYSGSEEVVPLIVKLKDRKREQITTTQKTDGMKSGDEANKPAGAAAVLVEQVKEEQITEANDKKVASSQRRRITREMNIEKLGRPSYYIPIFVVVILLLLAVFGRSFVILCTSIGWYLVPTLKVGTSERTASSSVVNNNKKNSGTGGGSRPTSPKISSVYRV